VKLLKRKDPLPTPDVVFAAIVKGGHDTIGAAVQELSQPGRDRSTLIRATIRAFAARYADTDLAALLAHIAQHTDEQIVTAAGRLVCARLHDAQRMGRTTIGDQIAAR
jgi:hypothetical protein